MDYKPFAETLAELLKAHKVSRIKLGEYLGITNQAVSAYTLGKIFPDYEKLLKIAEFFNVSLDYLLTGQRIENKSVRDELRLSEKSLDNIKENTEWLALDAILSDKNFYKALEQTATAFYQFRSLNTAIFEGKGELMEVMRKNLKPSIMVSASNEFARITGEYFYENFYRIMETAVNNLVEEQRNSVLKLHEEMERMNAPKVKADEDDVNLLPFPLEQKEPS